MAIQGRRWSVGELTKATGTTVRALHHYDALGLLSPSERTPSGHRVYTDADVRRLYRLRALRSLGMPLQEVGRALACGPDDGDALREILERQREAIAHEAAQLQKLQEQIRHLLRRLDTEDAPDPDELMKIMERMTMFENYFNADQQKRLAERRDALGKEGVEEAKREWSALVDEGLSCLNAEVPPAHPRARELVRRWDELGARFHAGEDTKDAARQMWQENSDSLSEAMPWTAEQLGTLVAYLAKARKPN